MERLFRSRVRGGELEPFDRPAWDEALRSWPHAIVWVALQDEKRVRSNQQNRYWWSTVIPIVGECWQHEKKWAAAPPRTTVHGALVRAVFGTIDTPLGPERVSSTTLTTEQFTELIEWAKEYVWTNYRVRIPEPNEVPA